MESWSGHADVRQSRLERKKLTKSKGRRYILITSAIQQEKITITNIYTIDKRLQTMKFTRVKKAGDFTISLLIMDITNRGYLRK
jgi:hypothetical protein